MNAGEFVDLQRYRRADAPALIMDSVVWTHGQLADHVGAFAAFLSERGIGSRDRVALLAMNSPEYVAAVLAVFRLGAIAVPLNFRLHREELAYLLSNAGVAAVIGEAEFLPILDELTVGLPLRARVSLNGGSGEREWPSFSSVLQQYAGRAAAVAEVLPGDPQRIMYTSGTTSRPKGVIVTNEMSAYNTFAHSFELELTSADRVLVCSPLFHVAAWDAPGVGVLAGGGSLVIMRRFDAAEALRLIAEHRVTGAHLVRSIVHELVRSESRSRDLSSLRWIIFGGVSHELYSEVQELLPTTRLVQGYGMTEACSAIAYIDAQHAEDKLGSVGTAVPFVQFRVVDDDGADAGTGRGGEVVIRGSKVTPGYWADPEATEIAWRGGWFHTGDAGVIDGDGYLSITDRLKDMIKSGGENVASQEIERVIGSHPAVAEVAVVAMPDPRWQEVPVAFVTLEVGGELTEGDLIAYCRTHLASFKTPKAVTFVSEFPRNSSGKILKRVLRDRAAGTPTPRE